MQIRYTSKAKKAIDQASKMSKSLHHHYIGTEHILIGLLKEGTGVAAQVLNDNGVELDKVMQLIEELIAQAYETVALAVYSCWRHAGCGTDICKHKTDGRSSTDSTRYCSVI